MYLQVPLGIIDKNENHVAEMMKIMAEMQKYVPCEKQKIVYEHNGTQAEIEDMVVHPVLFGGDQLTVQRARAAQIACANETLATERLEGLVPVFEDWHTKMTLLTVSHHSILIYTYQSILSVYTYINNTV